MSDPIRRCVVTGARGPTDPMIRFVIGPDGCVTPDLTEKLPGRGYWVKADRNVLSKAIEKRAFARASRRAVDMPADLITLVEAGLARHALGLLGLARRAGAFVSGFDKVRSALCGGRVAALLEASDGAEDGRAKLLGLAARNDVPPRLVGCFDSRETGLATGRDLVVHGALTASGLSERFLREIDRLAGFRPLTPPEWRGVEALRRDGPVVRSDAATTD